MNGWNRKVSPLLSLSESVVWTTNSNFLWIDQSTRNGLFINEWNSLLKVGSNNYIVREPRSDIWLSNNEPGIQGYSVAHGQKLFYGWLSMLILARTLLTLQCRVILLESTPPHFLVVLSLYLYNYNYILFGQLNFNVTDLLLHMKKSVTTAAIFLQTTDTWIFDTYQHIKYFLSVFLHRWAFVQATFIPNFMTFGSHIWP